MDLIRGGMLLMDGTQKQLVTRWAIDQERRIMQADIDEQDRLAAEAASQNQNATTAATAGNENEGSGTGAGDGGQTRRRGSDDAFITYHDVEQRLAAFWDGFVPFADPFGSELYQDCWECSASRVTGEVTMAVEGTIVAGAAARFASVNSFRLATHGPHHSFGSMGRLPHWQLNWWRPGVKGSGGAFRIPFPRGWWSGRP
jgi:hypothetical protein